MLSKALFQARNITPVASRSMATMSSAQPKRIIVTGAAGQISYSVLFRIAR